MEKKNRKDDLGTIRDSIRCLIFDNQNEQEKRLGDLSRLNTKTVIAMEQTLRFWCADAFIRLIRLSDIAYLDPWKLYDWAVKQVESLSFDELMQCHLQAKDERSLEALIRTRTDVVAFQKELDRRLRLQKVGRAFAYFLDHSEDRSDREALISFLNVLGRQINALTLKMKWERSPQVGTMIKALKGGEYHAIPRDVTQKDRGQDDFKNKAILIAYTVYDDLKKKIDHGDIGSIRASLISEFRKANDPVWERECGTVFKEELQTVIETRLPLYTTEMEEVPFKVYNSQRARDLRELTRAKDGSKVSRFPDLSGLTEKHIEDKLLLTALRIKGKGEGKEETDIFESIKARELLELIKDNLRRLPGHADIKRKVEKVFELISREDITDEEASERAGLSDRTMRAYIAKLRIKLIPYLS